MVRFVLQIRVLCGVDHEDLNQLTNVSKAIREAVSFHFYHFLRSFYAI